MAFSFTSLNKKEDLFLIEKEYTGSGPGSDISGPYWMLIEVEVLSGSISWISNKKVISRSEGRNLLFLPEYSWTIEHYKKGTQVKVRGLISRRRLEQNVFHQPVLFLSRHRLPKSADETIQLLKSVKDYREVGACRAPSSISGRAKLIMDSEYQTGVEISEIARRLRTSPASLSRIFKADFGQNLVFYRKGLRATVGMYELMMGSSPVEAAELAGYNDLGRFYKQFKDYLKQTPAEYLEKSKSAKKAKRS